MTAIESVILVNENDEARGIAEKMQAHREGLLHRAFSILLYRKTKTGIECLLQQRAQGKYHSAGLWSNTCCSHPKPGEKLLIAAKRRLQEEFGMQATLKSIGHFIYRAELDNHLIEHELDHVLIGEINPEDENMIRPNPEEISEFRWMNIEALIQSLQTHPEKYTAWLTAVVQMAKTHLP